MNQNHPVTTEIATIEKAMQRDRRNYSRDPEVQDRYRALLEARMNGASASRRASGVEAEKKQIETAMKDRHSDYFHGPRNADGETELAARYHQILEDEAETARAFMAQRDAPTTQGEMNSVAEAQRLAREWMAKFEACSQKP